MAPWLYPVTQEDVGRLCATLRPQTDDAFERCPVQEVWPGLPRETDTAGCQLLDEFSPSQRSLARKYIPDDADSSRARILVQAQFFTPPAVACNKHGTEERQEPAQVLCCQQGQRATLAPRTDDRTLLFSRILDVSSQQISAAHTYSQHCGACILRLDATQVLHNKSDTTNRTGRLRSEPLSAQAQQANLVTGQGNRHEKSASYGCVKIWAWHRLQERLLVLPCG